MFYLTVNAASIAWSIKPRSTLVFTVQLTELIVLYPTIMATIPRSIEKIRGSFLDVYRSDLRGSGLDSPRLRVEPGRRALLVHTCRVSIRTLLGRS